MKNRPDIEIIKPEVEVTTARSGGAGGQHVNKVETKVILKWNVQESLILTEFQKARILAVLNNKISKSGELIISSEDKRSQLRNKEIAFNKLDKLIAKAFFTKKKRIKTKPSKGQIEKRINSKKRNSEKKEMRKKIY